MYHGSKIIVGLLVFLGLVTLPLWSNLGKKAWEQPKLQLPSKDVATECVEGKEWMRENHMQLLNDWRDWAIRDGNRIYVSQTNHKEYVISLQNTCMKCHVSKEQFCDKCHDAASVSPYCWDCHIAPKEEKQA